MAIDRHHQQLQTRERREKPARRNGDSAGERQVAQERELALLLKVAGRRGFVTQQLGCATLSPLARWYHQLQLLALDGESPARGDEDADPGAGNANALAAALQALDRALGEDDAAPPACFDVCFAPTARSALDAAAELLDGDAESVHAGSVSELLRFSTMKRGRVCRVTCARLGGAPAQQQYAIRSSVYVRDLEASASQLLLQSPPSDAGRLLQLIWRELGA